MEEKKKESSISEILAGYIGKSEETKTNYLASLLAAFSYKKYSQYFLNQVVYIDDYTFERCRFDGCRLITFKGTFRFVHCVISENTVIEYGGEAFKIATLFNSKTAYARLYPNFTVTINLDGTFTLE